MTGGWIGQGDRSRWQQRAAAGLGGVTVSLAAAVFDDREDLW